MDLSEGARSALRLHLLDSLGCAFGALAAEPIVAVRGMLEDFGGRPKCTLIGGGRSSPDRATFFNGALVRYLDFNDAYLSRAETCHPSDNFPAVLAAAENARESGKTLLLGLAVAYQVQCRLSDEAPVRDRGFDHTTQGAIGAAAGVCRALGLDVERSTNAIAIAVTTSPALRVTRTGALSHWKGLAAPHAAELGLRAAFLAARGITGPLEAFEGNKGFMDAVSGPFAIDWRREDLERIRRTSLKRFNAEVHAQSAVEGLLELLIDEGIDASHIERIDVEIFGVAHRIIGGGEEGDKTVVRTKEQADHSLPYMLAVAALDRKLMPEQYAPERIVAPDVQDLLRRVTVRPAPDLSTRFPSEHPCVLQVHLDDGRTLVKHKNDYLGYFTRPMSWDDARRKMNRITEGRLSPAHQSAVAQAVSDLGHIDVQAFCKELSHHEWRRASV